MVSRLALVVLAGCAARAHPISNEATAPTQLLLYRDRALVVQRVTIDVPASRSAVASVEVGAGTAADDVVVVDRGAATISDVRIAPQQEMTGPTKVAMVVTAKQPGRVVVRLGYLTERITWDAAYTLTTTPEREHGSLNGSIAIRNATGIALRGARVSVVDTDHLTARTRAVDPRELGTVDVLEGDTRVELLSSAPRRLRSVLVYDPIGTRLDRNLDHPMPDESLGVHPPASPNVNESLEVTRDRAVRNLPAGPVRLLERRPDGSLAVLGETRMFDGSTSAADVDTISIGVAEGVTGHRERREFTLDADNARLVEDFVLTIDNKRTRPVEVVLREHLYRSQTWRLPYYSNVTAKREGPQQISLRLRVPAKTRSDVLYVVVYWWKKEP